MKFYPVLLLALFGIMGVSWGQEETTVQSAVAGTENANEAAKVQTPPEKAKAIGAPSPEKDYSGGLRCYYCLDCETVDENTPVTSCQKECLLNKCNCLKRTLNGVITRTCGSFGVPDECVTAPNKEPYYGAHLCACNTDKCNGSQALLAGFWSLFGLTIITVFVNLK